VIILEIVIAKNKINYFLPFEKIIFRLFKEQRRVLMNYKVVVENDITAQEILGSRQNICHTRFTSFLLNIGLIK